VSQQLPRYPEENREVVKTVVMRREAAEAAAPEPKPLG
jgi:hypothetical protein